MGVTRMGKTTIFLADDDEGVRRTLRTFLRGSRISGGGRGL
ncbi:MAG: hypothetical protein ACLRWQ_04310 [Flavonifractor plautii]